MMSIYRHRRDVYFFRHHETQTYIMLHYLDIETVLTFQIDIEQCDS